VKSIRQLREEQGWTQLELANRIGVTPGTVYSWERGKFEPRASQLRALALAFGVSMDDIELEDAQGKAIAA
jgi:transcriptional regulator with XRE-family HTH domain